MKYDKEKFTLSVMEVKDQAYRISFCYLHNEADSYEVLSGMYPGGDSTGGKGITNAREKSYKGMEDIIAVEDGYTLMLQNIIIDEDRIYLSAAAKG